MGLMIDHPRPLGEGKPLERTETMLEHPERSEDEVFVGNTETGGGIPEHLQQLTTARLGSQAYYIDGKPIPTNQMRPLFVHKSEADIYNAIMERRLAAARRRTSLRTTAKAGRE